MEKYYWESQGTIGFIFGLGVIVGFIVGIVIVYQILYSDVSDHLPEYATLKAMGYSDAYLYIADRIIYMEDGHLADESGGAVASGKGAEYDHKRQG